MGSCASKDERDGDKKDSDIIETLKRENPELLERLREAVACELKCSCEHNEDADVVATECSNPTEEMTLSDYSYPFENLVFEGGGGKGRIYTGALKCLEAAGIKAKRFAGSSAGAITATLLALNMSMEEVGDIMDEDLQKILLANKCGCCSYLPNFFRRYGLNSGAQFMEFLGTVIKERTENPDITFEEVYEMFGNELCVTAVDINLQSVVYFHVKTTPTMPVRLAVRMSMSIPGLFSAVPFSVRDGQVDYYVDGGVLCNYPIHVYDGWWLSLKQEDSYYSRLRPLANLHKLLDMRKRFGPRNPNTLGFVVYARDEEEIMQVELEKRIAQLNVPRPDTSLYRKKLRSLRGQQEKPLLEHAILIEATNRFVDALRDADIAKDHNGYVSREEFRSVFANLTLQGPNADKNRFNLTDARLLFGSGYNVDKVFNALDLKKDGMITEYDLYALLDKTLVLHARFLGYARREISGVKNFYCTLLDALQLNAGKAYVQPADLDRTIGLNTDYIGTLDFTVDKDDQKFLDEQGYKITELFLKNYVLKNKLVKRNTTR